LSITPDKSVYTIGETITLSILGDAEGELGIVVFGQILFDPSLATAISSSQDALTSFGGALPWTEGVLRTGPGFADAMNQIGALSPIPVDGPLMATVTLAASLEGVLDFTWAPAQDPATPNSLRFFGLESAPGTSVRIVPEPSTALLLGLGLSGLTLGRRR
jgi:hypothetical protein